MLRQENDLGIATTFEYFLLHFAVTGVIAALTAGRIHHNLPAGIARPGVENDAAALKLECTVHGVQHVAQCPIDLGLCGIERDLRLLRRSGARDQEKKEDGAAQPNQLPPVRMASSHSPVLLALGALHAVSKCHPNDKLGPSPNFAGARLPVCMASMRPKKPGSEASARKARSRSHGRLSISSISAAILRGRRLTLACAAS